MDGAQQDNGHSNTFTVQKIPQGGYLVWPFANTHDYHEPVFACTTLDEALAFIREAFSK